jgi:serine/threonine protein kinase
MPITIGTQLGSHEITALHRKGRMGEVYRARDTKLKREVGIKILPEEFSRDADRVGRFQREVDVLASLNHPNIAGIYDLQEANSYPYLVLELVEGKTLERNPLQTLSNSPTLLSTVAGTFLARSVGDVFGPRHLLFTRNDSLMAQKVNPFYECAP